MKTMKGRTKATILLLQVLPGKTLLFYFNHILRNRISLQKLKIVLNFIASGLGMLGRRYTLGEFFGGFRFLWVVF